MLTNLALIEIVENWSIQIRFAALSIGIITRIRLLLSCWNPVIWDNIFIHVLSYWFIQILEVFTSASPPIKIDLLRLTVIIKHRFLLGLEHWIFGNNLFLSKFTLSSKTDPPKTWRSRVERSSWLTTCRHRFYHTYWTSQACMDRFEVGASRWRISHWCMFTHLVDLIKHAFTAQLRYWSSKLVLVFVGGKRSTLHHFCLLRTGESFLSIVLVNFLDLLFSLKIFILLVFNWDCAQMIMNLLILLLIVKRNIVNIFFGLLDSSQSGTIRLTQIFFGHFSRRTHSWIEHLIIDFYCIFGFHKGILLGQSRHDQTFILKIHALELFKLRLIHAFLNLWHRSLLFEAIIKLNLSI